MIQYTCPTCDGTDIDVQERLIQEIDPATRSILSTESRVELKCRHCGWSGTHLQTVQKETSA